MNQRAEAIQAFNVGAELPDRVTAIDYLPLAFLESCGGIEDLEAGCALEALLRPVVRKDYWFVPLSAFEDDPANAESIRVPASLSLTEAFQLGQWRGRGFHSGHELARYGFVDPVVGWSIYVDKCSIALVSVTAERLRGLEPLALRRLLSAGSLGTAAEVLANPGIRADLEHVWPYWEQRLLVAYG